MPKTIATLAEIHELHRSGQIPAAKKAYRALLAKEPQNAEALHALGLIYVEENQLDKAAEALSSAHLSAPNHPGIALHLANVFKRQGLFHKSAAVLEQTLKLTPDYAPAYNNLGTVYYAQGKLEKAVQAYQLALQKQPDYIDAYYNLGLALSKQNLLAKAEQSYQSLLQLAPGHAAARFQLACLYMQEKNWNTALDEFLTLEISYPQHLETQMNLATVYLRKGALDEAKLHYQKALALSPKDSQILFNLGYIHTQQGLLEQASLNYLQILKENPKDFSAHNNLGALYSRQRKTEAALHHFQEALRLEPHNAAIAHIIKILQRDQEVLISPPEYLKSLFNYYADHYDNHLLEVLHYRVPQLLLASFLSLASPQQGKRDILDLGCGTGLCGQLFKPYAKHLVGVDLAQQMLKKAADKGIYDRLIEADLGAFLKTEKSTFDLIIAGDVLVYFGDLAPLFQSIKRVLKPQGMFIFNVEASEQEGFALSPSGRFIHHQAYIDQVLEKEDFALIHYELITTRQQEQLPVKSHIYLLQSK